MNGWFHILAAAMVMLSVQSVGASPSNTENISEIEQTVARSSYSPETRSALMETVRQAVQEGVPASDVGALVRKGIDHGADGRAVTRYAELVLKAARTGVPLGPVVDKIMQGIAKGVPPERVLLVAGRTKEHLETAARIVDDAVARGLQPGTTGERQRAVTALGTALDIEFALTEAERLGSLAAEKKRELPRFSRAVESMINLRDSGMPRELAMQTARHFIILDYSEKGIAISEIEMLSLRRRGASWENAATRVRSGYEQGPGGTGGPFIHGPGAGAGSGSGPGGGTRMNRR